MTIRAFTALSLRIVICAFERVATTPGHAAGDAAMFETTCMLNRRLAVGTTGINETTIGSVTWDTGVWSGKHTSAHPAGSLIIPCNAKGVPIADTLFLGRAAALRGYGKFRADRAQEDHNGGMVMDRYIKSVFGQTMATEVTENAEPIAGYTPDAATKSLTLAATGNVITFIYKVIICKFEYLPQQFMWLQHVFTFVITNVILHCQFQLSNVNITHSQSEVIAYYNVTISFRMIRAIHQL